jgi:tetrahydromethanopterin S-methyltransferase subunit B
MPEVGERMARLEEKVDNINNKIDGLGDTVRDFMRESNNRFADKWVELALKWAIGIIVGAVLASLLSLILITK